MSAEVFGTSGRHTSAVPGSTLAGSSLAGLATQVLARWRANRCGRGITGLLWHACHRVARFRLENGDGLECLVRRAYRPTRTPPRGSGDRDEWIPGYWHGAVSSQPCPRKPDLTLLGADKALQDSRLLMPLPSAALVGRDATG